jgi:hypothetical protein
MAIPGNYLSETTSTIDPNTSGWAVKLNCTLLKGTGGTVTDGCLQMKSVASGEMQARTLSYYQVQPGVEYMAFADASGATVPERIGIRWLDASVVELGITWSMTTASASATWHRIAVADFAPANAVIAQVLFSATPAAGNVSNFFDNVYFGLPQRTTGNLLSANTETSERSSSWAYTAGTNCTVSRTVPVVNWGPTVYVAGGHAATMTVTANGDADFRSTELAPVTPGQEYLAYAYLNPPSPSTPWIELRFYNSSSSQIQATRAILAEPGTGWYRQRVSDFAPAGAAYATVALGLTGATAGQILRTDAAVITVAPDVRPGTVLPYKDGAFEAGTGTWTVASGVATIARLDPWGTDAVDGSYCMTVSSATATTSVIRTAKVAVGAAAGQSWTVAAAMKVSAGGWNLTRSIRWYDASNNDLGATSTTAAAIPTPNWWTLSAQHIAPAGATQAAAEYTLTATSTSSVVRIDSVGLWQSVPLVEAQDHDDTASITLTLRELPVGATLTVWRVTTDGTRTLVRGTDGLIDSAAITAETVVIEDYEAPLGVPVSYYAEARTGTTLLATRSVGPLTLDHADANLAWLKDPGNPQRNLQVMVRRAPDWQRDIAQAEYRVRRRRNSVIHSDVRGGLAGDLVVWTRSDQERADLHWILDEGNVLLWQAAPGMGVADMYVNVGAVTEARVTTDATEEWREWTLPLKQADQPVTVGVSSSADRTWQDILTENVTWQSVLDRYATWEDVALNRPIGG